MVEPALAALMFLTGLLIGTYWSCSFLVASGVLPSWITSIGWVLGDCNALSVPESGAGKAKRLTLLLEAHPVFEVPFGRSSW